MAEQRAEVERMNKETLALMEDAKREKEAADAQYQELMAVCLLPCCLAPSESGHLTSYYSNDTPPRLGAPVTPEVGVLPCIVSCGPGAYPWCFRSMVLSPRYRSTDTG